MASCGTCKNINCSGGNVAPGDDLNDFDFNQGEAYKFYGGKCMKDPLGPVYMPAPTANGGCPPGSQHYTCNGCMSGTCYVTEENCQTVGQPCYASDDWGQGCYSCSGPGVCGTGVRGSDKDCHFLLVVTGSASASQILQAVGGRLTQLGNKYSLSGKTLTVKNFEQGSGFSATAVTSDKNSTTFKVSKVKNLNIDPPQDVQGLFAEGVGAVGTVHVLGGLVGCGQPSAAVSCLAKDGTLDHVKCQNLQFSDATTHDGSGYSGVCECTGTGAPVCTSVNQHRDLNDFDFNQGEAYKFYGGKCMKDPLGPVYASNCVSAMECGETAPDGTPCGPGCTGKCQGLTCATGHGPSACSKNMGGCITADDCCPGYGPCQNVSGYGTVCTGKGPSAALLNLGASAPPRLQTGAFAAGHIPLY